ncbi:MAG: hypothetical protein QME77_14045 [bacterium]|nr:hypothetical protein [bacterium]
MQRRHRATQKALRFGEHHQVWAALPAAVRQQVLALLRDMLRATFDRRRREHPHEP